MLLCCKQPPFVMSKNGKVMLTAASAWIFDCQICVGFGSLIYEPRCEKTSLCDFRPGPTQTRL